MDSGYIKLHRQMVKWEWYTDAVTKSVFLHLLISATYEPTRYRGIQLQPGDVVTGRKKLAYELGLSEQQVRTALNKLISTNEITKKSTNRFSVISIANWEKYQCADRQNNQQSVQSATNKQPASNQQATNKQPTDNHIQEYKESKEVIKEFPPEKTLDMIAKVWEMAGLMVDEKR